MRGLSRTVKAIVAFSILVLPVAADVSGDTTAEERIGIWKVGIELLDEGENERAASYFEDRIRDDPGFIEAADALVEAYWRVCDVDGAVAFLEANSASVKGKRRAGLDYFIAAVGKWGRRDFKGAARVFLQADSTFRSSEDTLSAVSCLKRAAQCYLDARDAGRAMRAVFGAKELLGCIPCPDRLVAEFQALTGEAFNTMDRLAEADSIYRGALNLAEEGGYRQVRGYCLTGLGRLNDKRQRDEEAVEFYQSALREYRILGAREGVAAVLNNLGQVEVRMMNLDRARRCLEESIDIATSCGSEWILGYAYYGLATIFQTSGDRRKAMDLFQQSFQRHEDQGNEWGKLGARLRIAHNLVMLGEYSNAVEHFRSCREAYERIGSLYGLSWALGGLALANHRLGDFREAEKYYRESLRVKRKLGDSRGAAWSLNSLGMVFDLQGRYREALEYEHEAMKIYEELDDRAGIGAVHFSIGSVYYYLGNYIRSLKHYGNALALANEMGDEELLLKVASGMGAAYSAAGRHGLAEEHYLKFLEISRRTGDRTNIIWALNNIASHYINLGREDEARRYIDEAADCLPATGEDYLRARVLALLGQTASSGVEAVGYTERALALAEENGLVELERNCLNELGDLYLALGDTLRGRSTLERAILAVESLTRSVGSDELRRHMLQPAIVPYERIVSLILDTSRDSKAVVEAFGFTERSRAVILANLLRETLTGIERDGGEEIRREELDLISRLTFLQARMQDGSLGAEVRTKLVKEMDGLEMEFDRLRVRMAERERGYVDAVYPDVEDTALLLSTLRPSERMLSYFLGDRRSYLFMAAGGDLEVYDLPPRRRIEERTRVFLKLLRQPAVQAGGAGMEEGGRSVSPGIPMEVMETAERELYELLLGPVKSTLRADETLVIIPDGLLHRLPFPTLKGDGGYLAERHELFYVPSLRALRLLRERAALRRRSGERPVLDMVAVGSSGIHSRSAEQAGGRVYPFTDIPVEPLVHAEEEARAAAELFPRSLVLTGGGTGEGSLKKGPLGRAAILHIAAHSYVDDEDVRRSFIVLNPEQRRGKTTEGIIEDGLLQWHEIVRLKLNASLVTLSACRSAAGVLARGEGVTGLTQAFLYAGANCVLASQVDIPDRFASRIMLEFNRNLSEGLSPAASLRAAQLTALEWSRGASGPRAGSGRQHEAPALAGEGSEAGGYNPALWASFVLVGDGTGRIELRKNESPGKKLAFAILLLCLLITVIILKKVP